MRLPSIKTLSQVFEDPKRARQILEMTRAQLLELDVCIARERECYHPPKTSELRLTALNSLESGLHGVEYGTVKERNFTYLNTGDTYAATVIYFDTNYRVQSLGDFIEIQERR